MTGTAALDEFQEQRRRLFGIACYRSGTAPVPGPAYGRQTFVEHLAPRTGVPR